MRTTMNENRRELLAEVIGPLLQKGADRTFDYARVRFKKAVEKLFEFEVARLERFIAEPSKFSTKEWERVRTDIEWTARRFMALVERMEERPLTRITDAEPKEVHLRRGTGKHKLSRADISEIKTLINAGELSLEEIAERFEVSPAQVSAIKNERCWPEVEPRINRRLDRYERKMEMGLVEPPTIFDGFCFEPRVERQAAGLRRRM
jgi:hypothetical protein